MSQQVKLSCDNVLCKVNYCCVVKRLSSLCVDDLWTPGGVQEGGAHGHRVCVQSLG